MEDESEGEDHNRIFDEFAEEMSEEEKLGQEEEGSEDEDGKSEVERLAERKAKVDTYVEQIGKRMSRRLECSN